VKLVTRASRAGQAARCLFVIQALARHVQKTHTTTILCMHEAAMLVEAAGSTH